MAVPEPKMVLFQVAGGLRSLRLVLAEDLSPLLQRNSVPAESCPLSDEVIWLVKTTPVSHQVAGDGTIWLHHCCTI